MEVVHENNTLPLRDPMAVLPPLLFPSSFPFSNRYLGLAQAFWRAIWQVLAKALKNVF